MFGVNLLSSRSSLPRPSSSSLVLTVLTFHRINLAYQELYLVLASIFRIYNNSDTASPRLEIYDTLRERDIDTAADMGIQFAKPGSLGLRVRVV